jgi:hypothetical protein
LLQSLIELVEALIEELDEASHAAMYVSSKESATLSKLEYYHK